MFFCRDSCRGGIRREASISIGKWERAVMCERSILGVDWSQEGKTIARFLGIKGMISINPFLDYKGFFFVESREKAG